MGLSITGAVKSGFTHGIKAAVNSLPNVINSAPDIRETDDLPFLERQVSEGVQEGARQIVTNLQANSLEIIDTAEEAMNPKNVGMWDAIKDSVLNDSDTGVRRIIKKGFAGLLWLGTKVVSILSASYIRRSNIAPNGNVQAMSKKFEGIYTGIFGLAANRKKKDDEERWVVNDQGFNRIADLIAS